MKTKLQTKVERLEKERLFLRRRLAAKIKELKIARRVLKEEPNADVRKFR